MHPIGSICSWTLPSGCGTLDFSAIADRGEVQGKHPIYSRRVRCVSLSPFSFHPARLVRFALRRELSRPLAGEFAGEHWALTPLL
jgi:hypothetical protein